MKRLTFQQKVQLRTLWGQGQKAEAIAAELGITYEHLRRVARRLGLPRRISTAPRDLLLLSERQEPQAYALWRHGYDTQRIAQILAPAGGEAAVYNSLSNYRAGLRQ